MVPPDIESVQRFFGFTAWPAEIVPFDLGGRVVEVTGCPGHQETSIAVHDPWSGFLVTGDTCYRGRLYVHEPALAMTVADLRAVRDAAVSVAARPDVHVFDEFIIFHGRCRSARRRHFARLLRNRLRNRLVGLRWRSDSASISVNRRPVAPSQNSPA
ncbi:hypothetical protein [Amycolatopsis taiwanensis]|uniref:Metallo-beta-lactamase domain-containing protein n=1 Tax=Amycolatopsis taiwanensis TaxID=342230 RepID=A0A9W6R3E9_9PSEU|nr:hypothetical protein [Amycolatopsis taiwanensis]GLY66775.1 hypothetical protein Atai01_33940 [Amycolatopsis taiwanensis]